MQKSVYEFISKQTNDPIVEWKTCRISGTEFPIYKSDLEFYNKISPVINGKKYQIPTPTLCPEERQRRRLACRNERKLYKRKCDFSGKEIVSIYSPDKPYKVYDQKIWRSDQWDPIQYERDFDTTQSFFKQFDALIKAVPRMSVNNKESQNSDFCNVSTNNKNCYLSFAMKDCENCYHSYWITRCQDCIDCTVVFDCQQCYELIDGYNCYQVNYSQECIDCKFCNHILDCQNCQNCQYCIGLRNKEFCILNKQYTPDEYKKIQQDPELFEHLKKEFPKLYTEIHNSENCGGNHIKDSKDCQYCFNIEKLEAGKYAFFNKEQAKNIFDADFVGGGMELGYEIQSVGIHGNKCYFSNFVRTSTNILYSDNCQNCQNCFGCVGLKNKQFCILNKQYNQEEYELLVVKIIEKMIQDGEWGEFFDPKISTFGYNETAAIEHYPATKEEILAKGYTRSDYEIPSPQVSKTIKASELPANELISEDIINRGIVCKISSRPFKIIKPELDFYRKHNIPLPHKHPDIRHQERIQKRSGRNLFLRKCDKCSKELISAYPQEYDGKIYCEICYNKEIYG